MFTSLTIFESLRIIDLKEEKKGLKCEVCRLNTGPVTGTMCCIILIITGSAYIEELWSLFCDKEDRARRRSSGLAEMQKCVITLTEAILLAFHVDTNRTVDVASTLVTLVYRS